jgi:hypothetical protein
MHAQRSHALLSVSVCGRYCEIMCGFKAGPLPRQSSAITLGTPLLHSRQPMIVVHSYPASHPAHRSGTGYLDSRVT